MRNFKAHLSSVRSCTTLCYRYENICSTIKCSGELLLTTVLTLAVLMSSSTIVLQIQVLHTEQLAMDWECLVRLCRLPAAMTTIRTTSKSRGDVSHTVGEKDIPISDNLG